MPVARRAAPPRRGLIRRPFRRRRRRGGLTGRALALGVVVVLLAVVLASPLQRYLQQRDSLAASFRQERQSTARVNELQKQLDRWDDPTYVEQQARARLQYARPGDTVYVVVGNHAAGNPSTGQATPTDSGSTDSTWQSKAWTTLQVADGSR